jgi:hypothetical protein
MFCSLCGNFNCLITYFLLPHFGDVQSLDCLLVGFPEFFETYFQISEWVKE